MPTFAVPPPAKAEEMRADWAGSPAPAAGAATLVWFFTASAAALISSRLPQSDRRQLLAATATAKTSEDIK